MDTRELPEAKNRLERDIGQAVRDLINDFKKETGICVAEVRFGFEETTSMGDIAPQFSLSVVETDLST